MGERDGKRKKTIEAGTVVERGGDEVKTSDGG